MSDTFLSLSCALIKHGPFFSLLSIASAALFGLFTLIFHISTQSLGGVTRSRFYQSLVAGFIARTFPHRPIAGLSTPASGGYILEYLLCFTEGLQTRLCNELSVSLAQR